MRKRHANIPIFIPHLGCPNRCVFCNQRTISGVCSFQAEDVRGQIEAALATISPGTECEIAYFGGSFTAIPREDMVFLLNLAEEYVKVGRVSGIRMSTRPDCIREEILDILDGYTISAVELGIQSFSDSVLTASRRGHTAEDSRRAMTLLRQGGYAVVGQMMVGLPGATMEDEVECARRISELGATAARIYPTLVFRDTELYRQMTAGKYTPLSLDEAVARCAAALDVFLEHNVECLRIGLCESENLHEADTFAAGPNHPAMGELVRGEIYWNRIRTERTAVPISSENGLRIEVPRGELSAAIGQNGRNKQRIREEFAVKTIQFTENNSLKRYHILLHQID